MEAPTGIEPVMEVLQTSALPLGYGATRPRSYHRAVNVSTEAKTSSANEHLSNTFFIVSFTQKNTYGESALDRLFNRCLERLLELIRFSDYIPFTIVAVLTE